MTTPGAASAAATERFRQRFASCDAEHFRRLQEPWASSIGLGTYLGDADDRTDALYDDAIRAALRFGCNVIDTAINYRCQRSERVIGTALASLFTEQALRRDELILCTKGGYLPFDGRVPNDPARYLLSTVVDSGLASYEEIVAGCHCLTPAYLDHALAMSRANLRVETIDVYYLHNPEQQLDQVDRDTLDQRIEAAFALLEQRAQDGALRCYGVATWEGLRANPKARNYLSLERLLAIAERVGGSSHRFRAVQAPYNLSMPEAFSFRNQPLGGTPMSLLEAAHHAGLSVMASAALLQGRLLRLPQGVEAYIPGPFTAAQRAVQFARSAPGVTTALVGMMRRQHVEENLAVARRPLLGPDRLRELFQPRTRGAG